MSDQLTKLATESMAFSEYLDEVYGPEGYKVATVMIVADVIADDEEFGVINPIETCASDPRKWVQQALLSEALEIAEEGNCERHAQAQGAEDD